MLAPASPVAISDPPPIPGARLDSTGMPARPLLIWVRTGTAHVRLDGSPAFHLSAGEGAWIPETGWRHREVVTEPGTVAFPLTQHVDALSEPSRFAVPDAWQDWLIQLFNLQVTPLSGPGYVRDSVADLLRRATWRRPASSQGSSNASPALLDPPSLPRAAGARAVAEELIRDPALDLTLEEWATHVLSSPRTLRRDFLAGTGLTFERWRLSCRLSAALTLLVGGVDVDHVASRVGFESRSGFTRAFRQRFALTPFEFAQTVSSSSAGRGGSGVRDLAGDAAAHQAVYLMRMVRSSDTRAVPEMLPAANTPPHANDIHVLSWVYRGSGYLDIGDRRYERDRGVATWIPADVEHVTGLRENSVSLPLGNATTGDLQMTEPLQVRFSPAWDNYLMFCSVSARSGLRAHDYAPRHILELFADQVAAQRALSVPMPTDSRARVAAMDYLRSIGAPAGSGLDVSADIQRTFREQTGMTYARWCYAARMRIARDLLAGGAKPVSVARRVGYAHLSTFSAAFTRFHGMSAREYQEREIEKA